jgi:hypothetical protein
MNDKDLISKLNKASNHIAKLSRQGRSDYIVTSKWFADWFNKVNNSDRVNKINRILDAIK